MSLGSPRFGWARLLGLVVLLPVGALPSLLFFVWMERGARLSTIPSRLGWPLVVLSQYSLATRMTWNLGLLFAFGAVHSGLAQPRVHQAVEQLCPPRWIRLVYFAVTGLCLWWVMACWQNTGIVLWSAPLYAPILDALSLLFYWSMLTVAGVSIARSKLAHFIGVEQLHAGADPLDRVETTPSLNVTGLYARVRHPVYAFTLLALLAAPQMSLDRALLLAGLGLYIVVAIPIEERKLVALFGNAYRDYSERVPALIPSFGWDRNQRRPE